MNFSNQPSPFPTPRNTSTGIKRTFIVKPKNIVVLGAGSFGTACAIMFARGNLKNRVTIYDYKQSRVDYINQKRFNPDYLTDCPLPNNLHATTDPNECFLSDVDFIFHAIPVQSSVEYLQTIKPHIDRILEEKKSDYLLRTSKGSLETGRREKELFTHPGHGGDQAGQLNQYDLQKQQSDIKNDQLFPPPQMQPNISQRESTNSNNKFSIAGIDFQLPTPKLFNDDITDPLDLQFIRPLIIISMSKGIHQQRLQCLHEILDDVFHDVLKLGPVQSATSSISHLDILTNDVDPDLHLFSPNPTPLVSSNTSATSSPIKSINDPHTIATTEYHASNTHPQFSPSQREHPTATPQLPSFLHTCYLSGPSFAHEIATRQPTGFTIASVDITIATLVGEVLSQDFTTLCSTSTDIWGVEIAGALKNVYAIGAGLVDSFQYNTKALYITRSCNEMKRIALLLYNEHVNPATFSTLAGMGDLMLSCIGPSRNRGVGIALAQGKTLDEIRTGEELAEGVPTTHAIYTLLAQKGFLKYTPILLCVYRVLYEQMPMKDAMIYLLSLPVVESSW